VKSTLSDNELILLRLSTDFNYTYYVESMKNFNSTNPHQPNYYRAHTKHLGFIEENTPSRFGFSYNNKRYASVFSFEQPWRWEATDPDPLALPWVLFFLGSDDTSWFKRFAQHEFLDKYWQSLYKIDSIDDLTYFN